MKEPESVYGGCNIVELKTPSIDQPAALSALLPLAKDFILSGVFTFAQEHKYTSLLEICQHI